MISIIENTPFLKKTFTSLREHLRTPLFANAYALMTNQVLAAGVGFLYWMMAARLYPDDVVGENSAIISTIIFLAALSEFSFKSAMTRFVPRAGRNTPRLILGAFGINLAVSFVVSFLFVTVGKYIPLTASLLAPLKIAPFWLVPATIVWSLFYIQDGVLIGMRQAKWVLVKNFIQSVSKLILLVVFFRLFADYGMTVSWFITVPVLILVFGFLIFYRFMPEHLKLDLSNTKPITKQELFKSITGDQIGTLLGETSTRLLPLIVLHLLGKSFTAYYYQGWNIATTLFLLATSMTYSFMVEASADMKQLAFNSRRILRQMASLLIPVVVVLWMAAPLILRLFGSNYVTETASLLRWLILSTVPYILTTWYLTYARVLAKVKIIIFVQALQLAITLLGSYSLIPVFGIDGIGMAWLMAHSVISIFALIELKRLFSKARQEKARENDDISAQALRRADWRFLLPIAGVKRSACFATGLLTQASQAISEDVLPVSNLGEADCDLIVASQPGRKELQKSFHALKPGGLLYLEWAGWRKGGIFGIRRLLKQTGFRSAKFYCALPSFSNPRLWLALEDEIPIEYISNRIFPAGSLVHRVGRAALVFFVPLFLRMGFVPSLGVIARKESGEIRDIFAVIREKWSQLYPETAANKLVGIMQTGGSLLSNNVIHLLFLEGELYPRWVLKMSRTSAGEAALQAEQQALLDLQEFSVDGPTLVIPRAISGLDAYPVRLYAQTALRGQSVGKLLHQDNFAVIATRMTDAQISLAFASQKLWGRPDGNSRIGQIIDSLGEHLEDEEDLADLATSRRLLSNVGPIWETYAHNDFAVWNMVDTPEGFGVFDWGDAQRNGLPLLDLVYGLSTAVFALEHADSPESKQASYIRLLDPSTPFGNVFQSCLARYAQEVGLLPAQIAPLRLLTWILHCTYERIEHHRQHGERSKLAHSVIAPLWKHELDIQKPI